MLSLSSFSQIHNNYRKGMKIPDKVVLNNIKPEGILNVTIEKPFPNGFYTLFVQVKNAFNEMRFIRLMNFELEEILSNVWGKTTLKHKKEFLKDILNLYGCKQNENETYEFYGKRWIDSFNPYNNDYDSKKYIYPHEFDDIITKQDTKDDFFGIQSLGGKNFASLLPKGSNITDIEIIYNIKQDGKDGIIVHTINYPVNEYYYRELPYEEIDELEFTLIGNYPKITKEKYICSKIIAYDVNSIGRSSSMWEPIRIYTKNGELDFDNIVFLKKMSNTNNHKDVMKSFMLEFIRSQILSPKEQEWYNKHFTKEQLDNMTRLGLGLGMGGNTNGEFSCRTCGASFSSAGALRSHQNAYHDY